MLSKRFSSRLTYSSGVRSLVSYNRAAMNNWTLMHAVLRSRITSYPTHLEAASPTAQSKLKQLYILRNPSSCNSSSRT
ncbi:hypothetical protein BgAZ_105640 [Babesia gibsoni]|uniref:Uncharacterized protein n=1 Tax=Babesia gibsoni TaxID=33632 RepID=A0AAD8UVM5_BABGI|nr:hypothetical protein BgAZ_105640 [Babesia gibsoni]